MTRRKALGVTVGGAVIVIERKGQPVAELRPISKKMDSRLLDLWRRHPAVPGESGRFLEQDRI